MSTAFENTNNKVSKLIATFILPIPTMLTLLLSLILLGCNRPSTPTTQAVGLEQVPAVSTTASALQPPQQSTGSQSKTNPKPKPQANSQAKSQTKPQTKPQENQWRVIAPSDALATIRMPKKPRYIERTFPPVANKPPIKVHLHMATVNEGKITYSFGHHDLHEVPINAQTRDKALEGAVRGSVANVQGELLSDVTNIRYKKSMGRQFEYQFVLNEDVYIVFSRVFLVGKRMYQINVISLESAMNPNTEKLAVEFINSFKLLTIENDEPPVPRIRK